MPTSISAAVEGAIDEAVVRRLVTHVGGQIGTVHGRNGKDELQRNIKGYNNAARRAPWLVLIDLDNDTTCVPLIRDKWVPDPAPYLCFRIAVREVEAWLMADVQTFAHYLSVTPKIISAEPEMLPRPKNEVVNLARRSRRKAIQKDMVPREGSGRRVGPAYASRLMEYVQEHWQPAIAAERAESLRRAITCLRRLLEQGEQL